MTKSEFDTKFNEKYKEIMLSFANAETLKKHLEKVADENGKITQQALFAESFLLSAEFSKNFIYSVLTDILELHD